MREHEEGGDEQCRARQEGGWKDSRTRGGKVLDGKGKPSARSSLLVKKLGSLVSKRHMEPGQEQGAKTLQINNRTEKMVREGSSTLGRVGRSRESRKVKSSSSSSARDVPGIFGTETGAEMLPSGNRFEETERTVAAEIVLIQGSRWTTKVNREKLVDDYVGFKRWLPPCTDEQGSPSFSGVPSGGKLVPISGAAIQFVTGSMDFLEDNSGTNRLLEVKGNNLRFTCGRYMGSTPLGPCVGENSG